MDRCQVQVATVLFAVAWVVHSALDLIPCHFVWGNANNGTAHRQHVEQADCNGQTHCITPFVVFH